MAVESRRFALRPGLWMVIVVTSLLSGSVFIHGFMTRILGVSLVCMVAPKFPNGTTTNGTNTTDDRGYTGTLQWSAVHIAHVVAVHNWARLVFLPLSGFIIRVGNPSQIFALATFLCACVTALFPTAANHSWLAAAAIRFLLGACHAFSSPCLDQIVASGTPRSIRSTIYAVITSGSQLAVIVGSPLGTFFCSKKEFFGGWPAIFYTSAFAAGIWICCWEAMLVYMYCRNRAYGNEIVEEANDDSDGSRKSMLSNSDTEQTRTGRLKTFFRDFTKNVLMEKAVWALYPCNIAATWTITMLIYYIPQFYRDAFKVSLEENGYYSAVPFAVLMVTKLLFSASADWLKRVSPVSHNFIAKSFNTVGMVGSGVFILFSTAIPGLGAHAAIALLCIGAGLYSATTPGFRVSLVCINRDWTGVISAVCTIVAMMAGSIFPFLVGIIVRDGTIRQWNILFALMAVADVVAAIVFVLFGTIEGRDEREATPLPTSKTHTT